MVHWYIYSWVYWLRIQLLKRRGKASLIKRLKGKQLTRQEAIEAKCYECSGGWPDGITKCSIDSVRGVRSLNARSP